MQPSNRDALARRAVASPIRAADRDRARGDAAISARTTDPLTLHVPIRRRDGVTHDEVVRHWRAVHMPAVIAHMTPRHYSVTIFEQPEGASARRDGTVFDGLASVTYDDPAVARREQVTAMPAEVAGDGFGALIRRSDRLQCTAHVIVDGPRPPGCHKIVGLVRPGAGHTVEEGWRCWLEEHAPNVATGFEAGGGLRYVVSLADRHEQDPPYVGLAELWFRDRQAARSHLARVRPDRFLDLTIPTILHGTETIGIA